MTTSRHVHLQPSHLQAPSFVLVMKGLFPLPLQLAKHVPVVLPLGGGILFPSHTPMSHSVGLALTLLCGSLHQCPFCGSYSFLSLLLLHQVLCVCQYFLRLPQIQGYRVPTTVRSPSCFRQGRRGEVFPGFSRPAASVSDVVPGWCPPSRRT